MYKGITVKELEEFIEYMNKDRNNIKRGLLEQMVIYLNSKYKLATVTCDLDREVFTITGSDEDKTNILIDFQEFGLISPKK